MSPRLALVLLAAAALVMTGCSKEAVTTNAATEGIWIDVGPLDYHIQGSRVLNPGQTPDSAYLTGLPIGSTQPTGKEVWFAVFLRIENKTKAPAPTARDFTITDTRGAVFRPYGLNPRINP